MSAAHIEDRIETVRSRATPMRARIAAGPTRRATGALTRGGCPAAPRARREDGGNADRRAASVRGPCDRRPLGALAGGGDR